MQYGIRRSTRLLLGAAVLAAGLVAAPLSVHHAKAFAGVCYDDPVVSLSNGMTLQLVATVGTGPQNVQAIVYNLTLPAGVSITGETLTGGPFKHLSTIVPLFTNSPGSYDADVYVMSSAPGASVSVDETASDGTGWSTSLGVDGTVNSDLLLHVQH